MTGIVIQDCMIKFSTTEAQNPIQVKLISPSAPMCNADHAEAGKWKRFKPGVLCLCILISLTFSTETISQRNEQLWLDVQLDYPFGGQYLLEATASYQTLISNDGKWYGFSLAPAFEYQGFRRVDLLLNVPFVYTLQTEDVNSVSVDPSLGVRLHITQNKRVNARFILKAEQRMFRQVEANDWDTSNRLRLRGEVWIAINGPNLYQDKRWYAVLDYEEFVVTDQQVEERFANRRRGRIGIGYRHNYANRFELFYTRQSSRNNIDENFISGDNVIQLRYKIYLNPARPQN